MSSNRHKPGCQLETAMHELNLTHSAIARCQLALERELKDLSTPNQTRVLLALHAQIGQQLDTYETSTAS